jgi:hypothetical protein
MNGVPIPISVVVNLTNTSEKPRDIGVYALHFHSPLAHERGFAGALASLPCHMTDCIIGLIARRRRLHRTGNAAQRVYRRSGGGGSRFTLSALGSPQHANKSILPIVVHNS